MSKRLVVEAIAEEAELVYTSQSLKGGPRLSSFDPKLAVNAVFDFCRSEINYRKWGLLFKPDVELTAFDGVNTIYKSLGGAAIGEVSFFERVRLNSDILKLLSAMVVKLYDAKTVAPGMFPSVANRTSAMGPEVVKNYIDWKAESELAMWQYRLCLDKNYMNHFPFAKSSEDLFNPNNFLADLSEDEDYVPRTNVYEKLPQDAKLPVLENEKEQFEQQLKEMDLQREKIEESLKSVDQEISRANSIKEEKIERENKKRSITSYFEASSTGTKMFVSWAGRYAASNNAANNHPSGSLLEDLLNQKRDALLQKDDGNERWLISSKSRNLNLEQIVMSGGGGNVVEEAMAAANIEGFSGIGALELEIGGTVEVTDKGSEVMNPSSVNEELVGPTQHEINNKMTSTSGLLMDISNVEVEPVTMEVETEKDPDTTKNLMTDEVPEKVDFEDTGKETLSDDPEDDPEDEGESERQFEGENSTDEDFDNEELEEHDDEDDDDSLKTPIQLDH